MVSSRTLSDLERLAVEHERKAAAYRLVIAELQGDQQVAAVAALPGKLAEAITGSKVDRLMALADAFVEAHPAVVTMTGARDWLTTRAGFDVEKTLGRKFLVAQGYKAKGKGAGVEWRRRQPRGTATTRTRATGRDEAAA